MSGLNCPVCKSVMQERNMHDVTIDECPQCRGIWLDRGELQKILGGLRADMESFAPPRPSHPRAAPPQMRYDDDDDHDRRQPHGYAPGYGGAYPKRKKSMVENLFEIFD